MHTTFTPHSRLQVRVFRTAIVQGFAQLGSDLLVDFDLMMTIPLLGPFFLTMTQAIAAESGLIDSRVVVDSCRFVVD